MLLAAATLSFALSACGSSPAPAPVTVTQSSTVTVAAAPTIAAPVVATPAEAQPAVSGITIPDIAAGTNAAIAQSKLEGLGLTNVELASANPDYTNVFLPKNWTLVSIEPAPGTVVQTADTVIVKVTKP